MRPPSGATQPTARIKLIAGRTVLQSVAALRKGFSAPDARDRQPYAIHLQERYIEVKNVIAPHRRPSHPQISVDRQVTPSLLHDGIELLHLPVVTSPTPVAEKFNLHAQPVLALLKPILRQATKPEGKCASPLRIDENRLRYRPPGSAAS